MLSQSQSLDAWRGRTTMRRALHVLLVVSVLLGSAAADPVAAQEDNPVCDDDSETLVNMIEGFVQLTTGLGVMGLLIVWQADELMGMFSMSQEQKAQLKQHKMSALKSASVLVLLGPLFTIGGAAMELPIAECVNLIPF